MFNYYKKEKVSTCTDFFCLFLLFAQQQDRGDCHGSKTGCNTRDQCQVRNGAGFFHQHHGGNGFYGYRALDGTQRFGAGFFAVDVNRPSAFGQGDGAGLNDAKKFALVLDGRMEPFSAFGCEK